MLHPLAKPEAAFRVHRDGLRIFLSEDPDAKLLREVLRNQQSQHAVLAIGPEGGWTDDEVLAARASQFQDASLGNLILRTETAVIAALANLNFCLAGS